MRIPMLPQTLMTNSKIRNHDLSGKTEPGKGENHGWKSRWVIIIATTIYKISNAFADDFGIYIKLLICCGICEKTFNVLLSFMFLKKNGGYESNTNLCFK